MSNYPLLALFIAVICSLVVHGEEKSYTYLSAKVMEEEIGIDWWNILNAEVSCCPQHTSQDDCLNEGGSNCVFFPKPNNQIAQEAGSQCVGKSYVKCKRKDINACCTPSCQKGYGPGNPAPPGGPSTGTPPVCGPKVPATPAPVTPAPVTPAPTTPSPTTPSPVTPSPVTPSPVTPSPVTPSPVTPSPVTPSPVTPSPVTPSPVTPSPVTPSPVTPSPVTPSPITPSPVTPSPITPSPVTPSPTTPSPVTPSPVTPSPTTTTTEACKLGWEQCGGDGYTGSTCCTTGYECIAESEWWSQCKPIATTPCKLAWEQCGGNGYTGATCCVTGWVCTRDSDWWSACKPGTPSPVTPSPTTPSPVTPSPVTPAPITPSPITPSPTRETGGPSGGNSGSSGSENDSPTRAPVIDTDECEHLTNYAFEGVPCQISGDPHFFLWNGAVHDFMGQPSIELDDKPMDQFYYVTQCAGKSSEKMPFRILGRQYNLWPVVSGLDYLIFELFEDGDDSGVVYYLFLSPDFQAYATRGNTGVTTYYDDIPSGSLNTITPGAGTITIGTRFHVTITETGTAYNAVDLTLEIDQDGNTYTNQISISCQSKDATRCRQTYANIRIDPAYKCRACGLCGDFVTGKVDGDVKQAMKACDGQILEFGYGSNADTTPEAYDPYGWTYERNYWLNTCSLYDNGNSTGGFQYVSPCDDDNAAFLSTIKTACADRTHIWADCCREVSEECVNLQKDCNWDVCVMSTVNGDGDFTLIEDNAIEAFDNAMEKLCNLPPGIYDSNNVDPYENCKLQYEQCGGGAYTGETCCKQGFACFGTSWPPSPCAAGDSWCACGEDPSQTSGCSAAWEQCGGKEWTGPTCCNHGYVCIWDTDYYSQCLPIKTVKKNDMIAIDSMNIRLNDTFDTVNMDYMKIGGVTFGILLILGIIHYYRKESENKGDKYIAIDDQNYGKTIPNYNSVV